MPSMKTRATWRARGDCIHCGTQPMDPGYSSCTSCREYHNEVSRQRRAADPEKNRRMQRSQRAARPEHYRALDRKYRTELKRQVVKQYGTTCVCCGETRLEFLTIDHIDGGGNKHRRQIRQSGSKSFYTWLKLHGFPVGFQTLCMNCNCAKAWYGTCPHTWMGQPGYEDHGIASTNT